ncbi:MAG: hypothetical protein LBM73_02535 [Candidatus Nomurabacteria bacterium]|jgi:hypothetical protein|nr:hypothetical protein [Candidatus Nomurabacteria bacterium]
MSRLKKIARVFKNCPAPLIYLVVFGLLVFIFHQFVDNDFGWHLAAGRYFLKNGIPAHDIFSYTASGFPWIDHEWLSDILLAGLYHWGGYWLLAAIYAAVWLLAVWLVGRRHKWLILLALLACTPFMGIRDVTWSVLGLALLLTILRANRKRLRLLILPLVLIWANFHGSFPVAFVVLIFYAVKERSWRLAGLTAVAAVLTLINPYGVGVYTEIWRTSADLSLHFTIDEWVPFKFPWATIPFLLFYASGFLLSKPRRLRDFLTLPNLFLLLALSAERHWPLFVVASLSATADYWQKIRPTLNLTKMRKSQRATVYVLAAIFALLIGFGLFTRRDSLKPNYLPAKAVSYLKQNTCPGNLFNEYNFGGYLIWQLPGRKVYIDGRMPSWKSGGQSYMKTYEKVLTDPAVRRVQFAKYDIRCALVYDSRQDFAKDLKADGWRVAVDDGVSSLLLKNN